MRRTSTTVVRRRPLRRPSRNATATTPTSDDRADGDERAGGGLGRLLDVALQLADLRLEVAAAGWAGAGLRVERSQA